MAMFAVLKDDIVTNIIVADSLEIAEAATQSVCFEVDYENPSTIDEVVDAKKLKSILAAKTKRDAARALEEKMLAEKLEAERVAAIEAENERLRQAEAERLAAEEASKPKPVTGIFVKVEKN